jgi:hypothetical protein
MEAEQLQLQVVRARDKILGGELLDTLSSIATLAHIYDRQGLYLEARHVGESVVEGMVAGQMPLDSSLVRQRTRVPSLQAFDYLGRRKLVLERVVRSGDGNAASQQTPQAAPDNWRSTWHSNCCHMQ